MRAIFEAKAGSAITGRLEKGDKLPDALLEVCKSKGIKAGWIFAIGAVSKISVMTYEQEKKLYTAPIEKAGDYEILSLMGNVSLLEGKEFLHLHVVSAEIKDEGTDILAGHLVGADVFALEFVILPIEGVQLRREFDELTGLKLWHL